MIVEFIRNASLYALPLMLGVMLHEIAHGWTAEKFGDPTARMMGRITLNPIVHIDLVGTVLLPLVLILTNAPFLFGWAKPVPVNFQNLRGGRRSMAWVALSGPLTNLILAVISAVVYRLLMSGFHSGLFHSGTPLMWVIEPLLLIARISVGFNLVLMVINLLPVPPLDGGRVMVGLLPRSAAFQLARVEPYGILIVLVLIATGIWAKIVSPILSVFLHFLLG